MLVAFFLWSSTRPGSAMTGEEARCVLANKKVTFFGDSISRFCYFGLNAFLSTGSVREDEFSDRLGQGAGSDDYDTYDVWTEYCRFGGACSEAHRQHFTKDFDDFSTAFYFAQSAWTYPDELGEEVGFADLRDESDVVVFNHGWWMLKEDGEGHCGQDFDDDCEDDYRARLGKFIQEVLVSPREDEAAPPLGIFRTTSCCGEEEDDWIKSIRAQNAVAKDLAADHDLVVVDVFDTFAWDDIEEHTFDDRHPNVATCHVWNLMVLEAVKAANLGDCGDGGGSTSYPPSYAPTYAPTTYAPTTYAPTTGQDESHLPTRRPSPRPTPSPKPRLAVAPLTNACAEDSTEDSTTWFKAHKPSKSCAWVAEKPTDRCASRDEDGTTAKRACLDTCGCCEDSTTWFKADRPSKSCAWVQEAPTERCGARSMEGIKAKYACYRACDMPCCEDSTAWFKADRPSKSCPWVAADPEERCDAKDATGLKAKLACRVACGTCILDGT